MNQVNEKNNEIKTGWINNLLQKPWRTSILLVLLVYFLLFIGQPLVKGDWCLLNDYLGYYSAGQIMNGEQPALVYDYQLLAKYQADLYRSCGSFESGLEVISMVYLPIFLAPFQLFALLNFSFSTGLWITLNFVSLVLYLNFFTRKVFGRNLPVYIVILILISIPVFRNFIHGQVNLLLLIGMGEFIRAMVSDRQYLAGFWLGLLLVKPQMLILLLPFMLIQKRFKVLVGFTVSFIIILGTSFLLVGVEGMVNFINIIRDSSQGGATSNYQLMMNWRAVSYYITRFAGGEVGNVVLIGGSTLTAIIPLFVFRKKVDVQSPRFMVALLGLMAATTLMTFHAHTHSAIILIPQLVYLYMNNQLQERLFDLWFLAPSVFNFSQFLVGALVILSILPFEFAHFVNFSNGLVLFVVNFILLGWTITAERRDWKPTEIHEQ